VSPHLLFEQRRRHRRRLHAVLAEQVADGGQAAVVVMHFQDGQFYQRPVPGADALQDIELTAFRVDLEQIHVTARGQVVRQRLNVHGDAGAPVHPVGVPGRGGVAECGLGRASLLGVPGGASRYRGKIGKRHVMLWPGAQRDLMNGHAGKLVQADVLPHHVRGGRGWLEGGDLGIGVAALEEDREEPDVRTDIGHQRMCAQAAYVIAALKEYLLVHEPRFNAACGEDREARFEFDQLGCGHEAPSFTMAWILTASP
jgi:hypothetical protein